MQCFICNKTIKKEDDIFEQMVAPIDDTTMCKECKDKIETEYKKAHGGEIDGNRNS